MAKVLKKFEFATTSASGGFASKYRYDEWFDGQIWRLDQGQEFDVAPEKMRLVLKTAAHKRGFDININLIKDEGNGKVVRCKAEEATGLAVQVSPGTEEQVAQWNAQNAARKAKLREKVKAKKAAQAAA